jgi:murein DD-endopeptidase MepM/ murein hydrolase activator NlpD
MTNVSFVTIPTAPITQIFNNYNPTSYGGDGRHKGIDYGIMAGNPVYSCMDGEVIATILSQSGYGRHIKIKHADGCISIYGHLTKTLVSVGQIVKAGQEIGKSGGDKYDGIDGDGFSTGAHLHWEIRPSTSLNTDQGAVDPEKWCLRYVRGIRKQAEITAYLGLRSRVSPVDGQTIYTIPHRSLIDVIEEKDGWCRLLSLRSEWCSKEYLRFTGIETNPEIPVEEVPVPKIYTDAEKLSLVWEDYLSRYPEYK